MFLKKIREIRKDIHDILVEIIFHDRGGENFRGVKGSDIRAAFELYDEKFFNGQIQRKIKDENSSIHFFAKARRSGTGGLCGIRPKSSLKKCDYYIDIAPRVLAQISESKSIEDLAGIGCTDRVYCLQLILEHEIVHLMMILWGYMYKDVPYHREGVFTEHGELYQCILQTYFGHTKFGHGLSDVDETIKLKPQKPGLMVNWSDSCYIDSLTTVLLWMANDFYRDGILRINTQEIDYKKHTIEDSEKEPEDRGPKVFFNPCVGGSEILTEEQAKTYAKHMQQIFEDVYEKMQGIETFKCVDLRRNFSTCLPSIFPFREHNVSELYDVLTDIFPNLKLRNIPTIFVNPVLGTRTGTIEGKTMFQMWDFMSQDPEGANVQWENIDTNMLVFQNGFVPAILDYGSTRPEKIEVTGPIPDEYEYVDREIEGELIKVKVPKFGTYEIVQKKDRSFSEYILDGKYRLVGVVSHLGRRPSSISEWGGGHYIAYLRPKTDRERWYYYNDVGAKWKLVTPNGKLGKNVFVDNGIERPELYFYEKL